MKDGGEKSGQQVPHLGCPALGSVPAQQSSAVHGEVSHSPVQVSRAEESSASLKNQAVFN